MRGCATEGKRVSEKRAQVMTCKWFSIKTSPWLRTHDQWIRAFMYWNCQKTVNNDYPFLPPSPVLSIQRPLYFQFRVSVYCHCYCSVYEKVFCFKKSKHNSFCLCYLCSTTINACSVVSNYSNMWQRFAARFKLGLLRFHGMNPKIMGHQDALLQWYLDVEQ